MPRVTWPRIFRGALTIVLLGAICWLGTAWWRAHHYDATIRRASAKYGVDPALVKAVMWRESGFMPHCRGTAGEIGLMQLRDLAAIEWATSERITSFEMEHLLDPETNTLAGTWYLARLLKRYQQTDDPVPYALADYNAGRANVRRWLKDNPTAATNSAAFIELIGYPMTRRYVESILRKRKSYRSHFPLMSLRTT